MLTKKIAYVISFLILLVTVFLSYSFFSSNTSFVSPLTKYTAPKEAVVGIDAGPKTEECPMNGKLFSKEARADWEKRRPLGIMVENSTDARPQSGLTSADIIYEVVAEGGITRFLNIFYCDGASFIGPVRSARIYFVNLLQEYGSYPLYAHVGGANTDGPADALGEIEDIGWAGYNDLNQFSVPFPNFWRDYDRLPNRATEHTVYTSSTKLWDYAKKTRKLTNQDKDKKSWDANFKKWEFQDDAKTDVRGEDGKKISFSFWSSFAADYAVTWTYSAASNSYLRTNGGAPHLDKNTGKQMETKNVVTLFADESPANDGYPGGHILYDLYGTGDATVYQNGKAIKASWSKKNAASRMIFTDEQGKNISFVRGQIFVEILPIGNKVAN